MYMLGGLAEGVFGMAFTMILVRLISQEEFGAWRQFMVLASIVWNVAIFGLPRSLTYFYSTAKPEEQGAIARRTLFLAMGISVIASAAFYLALDYAAARFDSPGLAEQSFLFSTFLGLSFPTFIATSMFVAANRRSLSALVRFALSLLKLSSLVILIWGDASLRTFLLALNGFAVLQFVVLVMLYLKIAGPALSPLWQNFRAQLKFSADVAVQSMAGQIAIETDKLMVSAAYTPARFASYSVGARELPLIPLIPYSIIDSITPDLSRLAVAKKFEDFRDLWHRWIKRTALLMYPVFALVLFQHKEIITILYTSDYLEGALPLLIIGCMIPMRVTSFYQTSLCLNGSRSVMYASIANLIMIASMSWIFLPLFGLWGPALAVLVSEYVINAGLLLWISKAIALPLKSVLPWGYLSKLLLIAVASGALALPAVGLIGDAALLWKFLVYGFTLLILYGAAVMSLSMVSSEDLALLKARLRR